MGWKERLHEDFSSGLGDLLSAPGNGSIAVSGGELVMQTVDSVDCNWWLSTERNAPHIYRDFDRYRVSGSGVYMVEIRLNEFNILSGNSEGTIICAVEADTQNYWLAQHYRNNSDYFNIGWIFNDVWTNEWSGDWSGRYWPDITYRLYLNVGPRTVYLLENNRQALPPGYVAFGATRGTPGSESWVDDIWVRSYAGKLDGVPPSSLLFRFIQKNYTSFPAIESKFDDLYVYEWEHEERIFDGTPNEDEGAAGRASAFEDHLEVTFPEDQGTGKSIVVPSDRRPPNELSNVLRPKQGLEDTSKHDAKAAGIPQQIRHTYPQIETGLYLDGRFDKTRVLPNKGLEDLGEKDGWRLGPPVQYHQTTLDPLAHAHFVGLRLRSLFYYRTEGEPWANPIASGFTGFAKDGFRYTAGVLDVGPVEAPWRQEAVFTSGNRSSRPDFPDEVMIAVTDNEVVLFDVDAFPAQQPTVWMRFEYNSSDYWMVGRNTGTVIDAAMKNGTLVTCTTQSTNYGGISVINFTRDGETDCAHLIRQDGHWRWNTPSYDIRDRNTNRWTTSGVSPSLRIQNEYNYSVDIYDGGAGKAWVAFGGEDAVELFELLDGHPEWMSGATGKDIGIANNPAGQDTRNVLFDESGWLWFSIENKLFRAVFDYQGGILIADKNNPRQRAVEFQEADITCLAQGRNHVYVGTNRGVYRVHKASLRSILAYTIVGGGGGGLLGNPPDGELLAGESPEITGMFALSTDKSTILQVQTKTTTGFKGGVTTIRLTDDYILASEAYPDIPEDALYSSSTMIEV